MPEDKKVTRRQAIEAEKKAEKKAKPEQAKAKKAESKKAAEKAPDPPVREKKAPPVPPKATPKRLPLAERTFFAPNGSVNSGWCLIDATGVRLGRLSSFITLRLMGKHSALYTPHSDAGDHVVVVNAEKVQLTGKKVESKWYHYHTGYPGGVKSFRPKDLFEKHPERVIERAVWGMMPKSRGHRVRQWYKKLHVYVGPLHPHQAQKPVPVELNEFGERKEGSLL